MEITLGRVPVIVRQECAVAFAGLTPAVTDPAPPPAVLAAQIDVIANGVGGFQYVNPLTGATALDQGGLFVFNEPVFIDEVRAFCGGGSTITVTIGDGTNTVVIANAVSANATRTPFTRVPILKGQSISISTTAAGTVDVYVVKVDM